MTLKGNILIDWLGNFIVNREASELRGPVINAISHQIKEMVQQFVNKLNRNKSYAAHMDPNLKQCMNLN